MENGKIVNATIDNPTLQLRDSDLLSDSEKMQRRSASAIKYRQATENKGLDIRYSSFKKSLADCFSILRPAQRHVRSC
jgi:hypothetical protein